MMDIMSLKKRMEEMPTLAFRTPVPKLDKISKNKLK